MVATKLFMTGFLPRVIFLAFAGTALIQWVHRLLAVGETHSHTTGAGAQDWLVGGTIALPLVAIAMWLADRRGDSTYSARSDLLRAFMYAGAMGAATLFNFPTASTGDLASLAQHLGVVLVVSVTLSLVVDRLQVMVDTVTARSEWRLARVPGVTRALLPLAFVVAALPVFLFASTERVAAQTSFPDQAIHPKGCRAMQGRA
jgi:hypothetical protein